MNITSVSLRAARFHWVALLLATGLLLFWLSKVTSSEVCCDGHENLRMAVSLAHHGVASLDVEAPFRPSMYREPLPIVLDAALIEVSELIAGPADFSAYQSGSRVRWLKYQNALWLLLLSAVVYIPVWNRTRSRALAVIASLPAPAIFFYAGMTGMGVDSLFTDIMGTALLTLVACVYAKRVADGVPGWGWSALLGLLFGALALIKAVFLPVFLGIVVVTPLIAWIGRKPVGARQAAMSLLAMTAGFLVVVSPWMLRNYLHFGVVGISERGGLSIYTRAVTNDGAWPESYLGAFYAWTPRPLKPLVGAITGFEQADLGAGGPLQRFNWYAHSGFWEHDRSAAYDGRPEDAISYWNVAKAELEKQRRHLRRSGHAYPDVVADQVLMSEGLARMFWNLPGHLAMTLPYLWRGASILLPVLSVAIVLGWMSRNTWLLGLLMPAVGMILFYALFSNFEERYGVPAMAVTMIAGACVLKDLWSSFQAARARRHAVSKYHNPV